MQSITRAPFPKMTLVCSLWLVWSSGPGLAPHRSYAAEEPDEPEPARDESMGDRMSRGSGGGMGMMGGGQMRGCGMLRHDPMAPPMGMKGLAYPGSMHLGARFRRIMELPDLTDKQSAALRARYRKLQRELWNLGGEAMDARFKLQDVTAQDQPSPKAVGEALTALFDVQRRMAEASVAALNDARGVLTDEQREALKQSRRRGSMGMGMHDGAHGRMGGR